MVIIKETPLEAATTKMPAAPGSSSAILPAKPVTKALSRKLTTMRKPMPSTKEKEISRANSSPRMVLLGLGWISQMRFSEIFRALNTPVAPRISVTRPMTVATMPCPLS